MSPGKLGKLFKFVHEGKWADAISRSIICKWDFNPNNLVWLFVSVLLRFLRGVKLSRVNSAPCRLSHIHIYSGDHNQIKPQWVSKQGGSQILCGCVNMQGVRSLVSRLAMRLGGRRSEDFQAVQNSNPVLCLLYRPATLKHFRKDLQLSNTLPNIRHWKLIVSCCQGDEL